MRAYYLDNSGFAIIDDKTLLIIDYYNFSCNGAHSLAEGVVGEEDLSRFEKIYCLVSHRHEDHFNPKIYSLKGKNITYILASGTPKQGAEEQKIISLKRGETYDDKTLFVKAFPSTDIGISFLIRIGGKTIFHAGDFNCWHWAGEWSKKEENDARALFQEILKLMQRQIPEIDVAFFPVDPRMQIDYDEGALALVDAFHPHLFVPMHMQGDYSIPERFAEKLLQKNCDTTVAMIDGRGSSFEL